MAWGKNGTPDTLASASDELSIADLTENKFNMLMSHEIYSGVAQGDLNFNNDKAGNDYATRSSKNGAADSTETSANRLIYMADNASGTADFEIGYLFDIASEEKFIIGFFNNQNTAGAGYAPSRREMVGKYDETASRITRIDIDNVGAGDFDTGSNLSALGSEITPAAAIPFAENVQAGSRAEITDTRKVYNHIIPSLTFEEDFSSDNWTTSSSTYIGIDTTTDNEMDFNNPSSLTGQHHSYYDLGLDNVSDTKWVLRWKWEITTISENSDGTPHDTAVGISNNTVGYNTAQDALTLRFRESSTNDKKISLKSANDPEIIFGGATDADFTTKFSVSTFYCELKRTSATSYTANIYSDSSYSTLTESQTGTCSSSITGLRYLKVGLNNNDGTANGQVSGHIDDVKFYNGVTQTTIYWQEIGA